MSKHVSILLIGAVAGLTLVGGCVPKHEYERLLAVNRRASVRYDELAQQVEQFKGEKRLLAGELAERDSALQLQKDANRALQTTNTELVDKFQVVTAAYAKLLNEAAAPPIVGTINILPDPLHKALQAFAAENPGLVDYMPKRGMVKLKSDSSLTFELGKVKVQDEAVAALTKLVEIMNTPEAVKFNIYVAGHTDDVRIARRETRNLHPDNWYLSVHRAVAIRKVLAGAGLADGRIGIMGFGEHHPVAPNKPEKKGNPLNRRVEIWIVPPGQFLTAAAPAVGE